jgi:hypothetical protein
MQNELNFKKGRVETLTMDFNSKEMEYQRVWEEEKQLKSEINGEGKDAEYYR